MKRIAMGILQGNGLSVLDRGREFLTCLFASLVFVASQALCADAALIAQNGNTHGAPACVTCHGVRGEGLPGSGFPHLAGLDGNYLLNQLNAFASGRRNQPMMTPIAQTLTGEERIALARYYGAMSRSRRAASPASVDNVGAKLALKGRWSDGLPACVQCHGATGAGVGAVFPALAGQSAHYIETQLRKWQQDARPPGPMGLMKVVASKLSPVDIRAVAGYFAALPPPAPDTTRKP